MYARENFYIHNIIMTASQVITVTKRRKQHQAVCVTGREKKLASEWAGKDKEEQVNHTGRGGGRGEPDESPRRLEPPTGDRTLDIAGGSSPWEIPQ